MRIIKLIFLGFFSLLTLILLIGVGIVMSINPNDYKTTLTRNISAQVGRTVIIKGDVHWSLIPQIGLQAEDVFVENRPGFATRDILKADSVQLQVKLAPLLLRKIVIKEIHIRNAKIALQVKASGENNWSDLSKAAPVTTTQKKKLSLHWARLDVNKIKLDGVHVIYDDVALGHHYDIENLQYTGAFVLDNDDTPALKRLNLNGSVEIDAIHFDKTQLSNLTAKLTAVDGTIHLNNIQAKWYDGVILASLGVDASHTKTSLELKGSIENANLEPMFTDLRYIDKITGTLDGTLHFTSNDAAHIAETLNGKMQMQIAHGVIHGINLNHNVQLISKVVLRKSWFHSDDNNTAFNAVSGDIQVVNGVARSNNLKLDSDSLETTGEIQANLAEKSFALQMGVKLLHTWNNDQLIQVQTCLGGGISCQCAWQFCEIYN